MLASGKARNELGYKRRAELVDDYPIMNVSKLRKGNPPVQCLDARTDATFMTSGNYGKCPMAFLYPPLMACCMQDSRLPNMSKIRYKRLYALHQI